MNRFARFSILGFSLLVFGWVGLGHVLGRTTNDKAYKSLVVYSEVLQKIQQDYVDEPNMHLVEAGSLHGLLESLDSESSYFTPREYAEYKQKLANTTTGETGLNLSKRFGYIIVTSIIPDSSADKAGIRSGDIFESVAGFTTREMSVGQAKNLLAGQPGTSVKVGVIRRGRTQPDEMDLSREKLPASKLVVQRIDNDTIAMGAAAARPDPLNPKRWRVDKESVDAPEYVGRSIVEMPDAPAQPWLAERPGIPAGQVERHEFKSTLLKNEREIGVYLPPGYSKSAKPYALLVVFDEWAYLGDQNETALVPTPTILNNLISEKRIPPMVALFIGNGPDNARDRELPCNPVFADFLSSELLPWAHGLYNFTTDPRQTVVGGSSFGGLASAYAGLRHPETFGNILSQSGSFHWIPPKSDDSSNSQTDSEPNWVAKQFITSPKLPLRFYLDAGSDEIDFSGQGNSILLTTRNLRDVLLAKGYEVHFQEFAGSHDYLSWRGTLADGLVVLMGNAPTGPMQNSTAKPNGKM